MPEQFHGSFGAVIRQDAGPPQFEQAGLAVVAEKRREVVFRLRVKSACLPGLPDLGARLPGIYEPVHGSAPDITSRGIANPIGMLLSVAMMFNYSVSRPDLARRIEGAVTGALEAQHRIGGKADGGKFGFRPIPNSVKVTQL